MRDSPDTPTAILLGVGSGIGSSLALRLGHDGFVVEMVARSEQRLAELGRDLADEGVTAHRAAVDLTDGPALREALERLAEHTGRVDVLHFNPSTFRQRDPLSLTPEELLADVALGVAPLLTAVQTVRPLMSAGARIVVTGSIAADRPWHEAASLGVQKAAVRNLVLSLDDTLRDDGIRATCLTVLGTLAPDTPYSPDRVAAALVAAARQPEDQWQAEVRYDGADVGR